MKPLPVTLMVLVLTAASCNVGPANQSTATMAPVVTNTSIATSTVAPTPTDVPVCDPARVGASSVLYYADFSSTSWGIIDSDVVTAGPADGVYKFTGIWFAPVDLMQEFPQDIVIESEVRFSGEILEAEVPEVQEQLFINFRQGNYAGRVEDEVFYMFQINADGYVWIDKRAWTTEDGVWVTGIPIQLTEPKQISDFKPEEFTRFRIDIVGDELAVYINNELFFSINDHFETNGTNAFLISVTARHRFDFVITTTHPYDIAIDNFCVYKP